MDIQECHDYFDLLIDKTGSPYLTADEKDILINQATIEYIKRHLPSAENPGVNLELDQTSYNNLYSLVYTTASTNMSAGGVVTLATLQTLLNTASSSTEPFMAILGLAWTKSGSTFPVKYTRQNNWHKDIRNPFKSGDATEPVYKYDKTNFTFYPVDTGAAITFTLLKQPKLAEYDVTDIELPSHTHKQIVEIAVDMAATAIRDESLKSMNSN